MSSHMLLSFFTHAYFTLRFFVERKKSTLSRSQGSVRACAFTFELFDFHENSMIIVSFQDKKTT
jgi:hypothetical protein